MKTVTCNKCNHSFQVAGSAKLPACPRCYAPVFIPGELYINLNDGETYEYTEKRKKRK